MTREEIIKALGPYFKIKELVCQHVYNKYGDKAWQFLSTDALHLLLVLRRDVFGVPMYVNTGTQTQRGLRCNLCSLVKEKTMAGILYLTAHNGNAWDFEVKGITAEAARAKIRASKPKLPFPIRMEKGTSWVHVDTRVDNTQKDKVYEFTA